MGPVLFDVTMVLVAMGLLVWALLLRQRVRRLSDEQPAPDDAPTGFWLSVVVLNPRQLARERSQLGARLAAFAPRFVTRRVYETVARELRRELDERGVDAAIRVHEPPSRDGGA